MEGGSSTSDESLVEDLIAIVDCVKNIGEFRRTQRKEGTNLVRRLKLFLPLLEEIRDLEYANIPLAAIACLKKLKKAFQSSKKLLRLCHEGCKIYLVGNSYSMFL